ncbi:hypothetical protein DL767_001494 [Monosporascus sp. MG133]|nr:hypothetical protein DL767_001494 [Monosporascus sp. MG133]
MNFTITVPEGTTNHGSPNLLCTPAKWYDILLFILTNYVAHAATVIPTPGQSLLRATINILLALTAPGSGVARAIIAVLRCAATERKNPLTRAVGAGALCMVLKKPAEARNQEIPTQTTRDPLADAESGVANEKSAESEENARQQTSRSTFGENTTGECLSAGSGIPDSFSLNGTKYYGQGGVSNMPATKGPILQTGSTARGPMPSSKFPWWNPPHAYEAVPRGTQVHGEYWLDQDYYLAIVPLTASLTLEFDNGKELAPAADSSLIHGGAGLASSGNRLKQFISLIQAIWAFITIYRTRGDQIQEYGYAAFGLTVAPYAMMSLLNLLANFVTPEYPFMFVIRTPVMDEAEREGKGFFKAAISVQLRDTKDDISGSRLSRNLPQICGKDAPRLIGGICWLFSLVPLAIVGGLSGFRKGNSTQIQRGFTMSWMVVGIVYDLTTPKNV